MSYRKKLIEVALPLEAINIASARDKDIHTGQPANLHTWWSRKPLSTARGILFCTLVNDPDDPNAPLEFIEACRQLPKGKNATVEDTPRRRLFDFIERLVEWESISNEKILQEAYQLICLSNNNNLPPIHDPFAGGEASL